MADTDPENEVNDRPTPSNRVVQSPNSDTLPDQVGDGCSQDAEKAKSAKKDSPPSDGHSLLNRTRHNLGYGVKILSTEN